MVFAGVLVALNHVQLFGRDRRLYALLVTVGAVQRLALVVLNHTFGVFNQEHAIVVAIRLIVGDGVHAPWAIIRERTPVLHFVQTIIHLFIIKKQK